MAVSKTSFEKFKAKTFEIIYGTNTFGGRLFDLILLGVILLSVLLTMLETVEEFEIKHHDERLILEWGITLFFTIEYMLRIISIKKPLKYIFSFYGIIDLIATLPLYLAYFFANTGILSVIRALRLLRLFKILNHPKFSSQSNQLRDALAASKGKIIVFIYFVLISTVLIGSVMYVVEGEESGFTSIPESIYWTIVTLTTVGYGDIAPITPLGQFIASFVMILGYGIIAVPTGIVSAEIAKSTQNDTIKSMPSCSSCGEHLIDVKGSFCSKCGSKLNEE